MSENKELSSSLNLLVKSAFVVFFGVALSKILTYAYRIIIARYFGPETYGLFVISLMIIGWFTLAAIFGLTSGITRYVAYYRGKNETSKISYLFKSTLSFFLITGLLSGTILFFLSDYIAIYIFHDVNLAFFLKSLSIAVPLTVLMNLSLAVIQAYEKIKAYSFIFNVLQNIIKVIVLVILITMSFQQTSIVYSYIFGIFVAAFAGYFFCFNKLSPSPFGKEKLNDSEKLKSRKILFSYSWPLMFSGILVSVFYWTDTFIVGLFEGTLATGLYNAAVPIALLLEFFPEIFMQLFFPMISREYGKKNFEVIEELSQQLTKWILMFNFALFLLIFIFPETFINILFGQDYIASAPALRILSIGFLFSSLSNVPNKILSMIGKTKTIFADIAIVAIINLILNIVLVSKYGITGVASATTISLIFLTLIFTIQSKQNFGFQPFRKGIWQTLLSAIVAILLLLALRNFLTTQNYLILIFELAIYGLIYISLIFLFKGLDSKDLSILKGLKGKLKKIRVVKNIKAN